jgi:predicted RNase H-like HicB family nuclease
MSVDHNTYRVTWSAEDGEHVGLCAEFPSLSWLAKTPEAALKGIRRVVAEAVADMQSSGNTIPIPLAESITAENSGCAFPLRGIAPWQQRRLNKVSA